MIENDIIKTKNKYAQQPRGRTSPKITWTQKRWQKYSKVSKQLIYPPPATQKKKKKKKKKKKEKNNWNFLFPIQ